MSTVGNILPVYLIANAQENIPKSFNVDIVNDLPQSPPPLKIELSNTDANESDVQLKIEKDDPTNPQIITSESSHNNETISLLLCEETIPGSPAPACGNIKEVSEILKKGFDMASTTSSSSTYSNPHPTTADIKPVPMDIENDTNPASAANSPDTTPTVVQTQQAPITTVTNTTTTTSGATLPTAQTVTTTTAVTTITTATTTTTSLTTTTTVNTGGKTQDKTDAGCTSNSSPRDSISQDESKSDSEDLKHQGITLRQDFE